MSQIRVQSVRISFVVPPTYKKCDLQSLNLSLDLSLDLTLLLESNRQRSTATRYYFSSLFFPGPWREYENVQGHPLKLLSAIKLSFFVTKDSNKITIPYTKMRSIPSRQLFFPKLIQS